MENPDPLENRPPAIKALYRNYEQRAEEAKKHAWWFLIVNIFLLVLAVFAVIYAPHLAIDDVGIYLQKLIDSEEEKLEEVKNRIDVVKNSDRPDIKTSKTAANGSIDVVENSDHPDIENGLEQLKTKRKKIEKSLDDLKKSQRENILGISYPKSSDFPIVLFQIDFLRIGLLTVLILMSQHVIKLARYNFRLMTFYRARQDVLLMTTTEALPLSKLTPKGLEQAANALSPDHVDPEISSKTPMEILRQRAPWRRKQTSGQ